MRGTSDRGFAARSACARSSDQGCPARLATPLSSVSPPLSADDAAARAALLPIDARAEQQTMPYLSLRICAQSATSLAAQRIAPQPHRAARLPNDRFPADFLRVPLSPMRVRSSAVASCLAAACLLLFLSICLPAPALGGVLAPPLISPPAEAPFVALDPIPASRTAYVAIHFEDFATSQLSVLDSEASLQGIRVMMASVKDPRRGASTRDRVVLVPPTTSAASRALFVKDGLIVIDMDASLPHSDICAPKFDRIYLWSSALASRYDRVLYLDWDVVVQRPMDHLFLCGQFCMVFNSILHFVDGIMVVKPDPAVFDEMVERYKRERLSSKWSSQTQAEQHAATISGPAGTTGTSSAAPLLSPSSYSWRGPSKTMCWEKSYIFFLFWFGNIEAAPLFNPRYGQSPLVLQRMDASIQLNAMMWYEKYSWTLMRGKEYRNMTNDQEVPALSLGYTTLKVRRGSTHAARASLSHLLLRVVSLLILLAFLLLSCVRSLVLQPFHWGPGLFFNLGWDWTDLRDEYLGTSDTYFIVTRMALWVACLLLATKGLRRGMTDLYTRRLAVGSGAPLSHRILSVIRAMHMKVLGPTDGFSKHGVSDGEEPVYHAVSLWSLSGYWLPTYGSDVMGVVVGSVHALLVSYLLTAYTSLIPQLTGAHAAWKVWLHFHVLSIYAFNHWIFLAYHTCPPLVPAAAVSAAGELRPMGAVVDAGTISPSGSGGGASSVYHAPFSAVTRGYPLLRSVGWLAFWELTLYVLMRRTFYPEFVVKMFVMFPLLGCILIAAINMNREVWRSIEQSKAYYAGHKDAAAAAGGAGAAGVAAPMLPGGGRR